MKTILIAEDNELNMELMVTVLAANGFEIITAEDGLKAVQQAQAKIPDLILMDIQMPKMDGYEALSLLRAEHSTADIPVIAVTGNAMPHDLDKIRASGFDKIVNKPFSIKILIDTVVSTLQRQPLNS